MKGFFRKLRSRRGMTLSEVLTAVLVLGLLTAAIAAGTASAAKVYHRSVAASEAQNLVDTLTDTLSEELRYARNIRVLEDNSVVFDSETFGSGVSVLNDGTAGVVMIGTKNADGTVKKSCELISSKVYTSGLQAKVDLTYEKTTSLFQMTITVTAAGMKDREAALSVRALNV